MFTAPGAIQTTVNYHQPQDEIPYYYYTEPPVGVPPTNAVHDPRSVTIHNMRNLQDAFNIDVCGFQWITHSSAEKEFVDKERIKAVYYPEIEDILKKHTGGKRVLIFNHAIRSSPDSQIDVIGLAHTAAPGPSNFVHADHTFEYAAQKVRQYLPDEAERLLKGRYQMVNVWRPIVNDTAHSSEPLGFVDSRSVDIDTDLVFARLIFLRMEGGIFVVKYNPEHKWYYLSDQTSDEALIFKNFDSDKDKAKLALHSALLDLKGLALAPSIEVRALVFDSV